MALTPDPATRAWLVEAAAALRAALGPAARDLRFAAPAALHLTLRFLGDVEAPRLEGVAQAVREAAAAAAPFEVTLRGAGAFPDVRRPRAVFLAVAAGLAPLAALASGLEARLVAAGVPPEGRPFHPHLTVARPRGRSRPAGLAEALSGAGAPGVVWPIGELALVESHLGPGGARHEPLLVAPLG